MTMSILEILNSRKSEMDSTMRDIASQQSELDDRRSRVEGRLYEIEYLITHIENSEEQ